MGYDLYITRAESWLDTKKAPILQGEWNSVVEADPELELSTEDYDERQVKRKIERVHAVIWTTHPDRVPLWFADGAVRTKNPDTATVKKLVALARKLNAKVLGEENEEYGSNGESLPRE
jgi:hypothetical protein